MRLINDILGAMLLVLLLSLAASLAVAGVVRSYQANITDAIWKVESTAAACVMTHTIPEYGEVEFARVWGNPVEMKISVDRPAKKATVARLHSVPPSWKGRAEIVDLGDVKVKRGRTPFIIRGDKAERMLTELEDGMTLTLYYRNWIDGKSDVAVGISPVKFGTAYSEFHDCSNALLPFSFDDINNTSLYFAKESSALGYTGRKKIERIARYLEVDKEIRRIVISGHTDNRGSSKFNKALSTRRADATRAYLVKLGIAEEKITTRYLGFRVPLVSNKTAKGRAKNRRTTVTLVR